MLGQNIGETANGLAAAILQAAAAQPLYTGEVACFLAERRRLQPAAALDNGMSFFERAAGFDVSGLYAISLRGWEAAVPVHCDMETDGGGWTLLQQRRNDSQVVFARSLRQYEEGFGLTGNSHWLGLRAIAALTERGLHTLRVDMWADEHQYAEYDGFWISGADYVITVGKYCGTAGDGLYKQHGQKFVACGLNQASRRDKTAHGFQSKCQGGGWWDSQKTEDTNLNGVRNPNTGDLEAHWVTRNAHFVPRVSAMKIRPVQRIAIGK
ncbi:fibrinogen C domain-containing protein 1-like [Pollicipes pollicipes]|uniref:fibrinogen C domain-containing protein 1-like n=1 Tax=Pollicipes pollicipes TaxID=41117 RepID=UPI0018850CD9|nr:fibrinogen C domain-containing protein 1-like [Pollicipes pollicipes]